MLHLGSTFGSMIDLSRSLKTVVRSHYIHGVRGSAIALRILFHCRSPLNDEVKTAELDFSAKESSFGKCNIVIDADHIITIIECNKCNCCKIHIITTIAPNLLFSYNKCKKLDLLCMLQKEIPKVSLPAVLNFWILNIVHFS